MSDEDLIEERKRKVAISIIDCLDNLWDITGETYTVTTTHYNNHPKQYTVIVEDSQKNKIGINIHKLK